MIPHSRPRFSGTMQAAVSELLQSGFVVAGSEVAHLEQALCRQVGRSCAVAVDSGSSALMLALRLLGRDRNGAEMRVGIPALGCGALFAAVRAAGMRPCAMDCDPETLAITDAALAMGLDVAVVVHPFGMVEPALDADWGCLLIEDIAQSAGAVWQDQPLGRRGRITIASFHATKPWGGVYGGALLLDDDSETVALRRMINPDCELAMEGYVGHHQLSNLHALLARMRLQQSDEMIIRRKAVHDKLAQWVRQAGGVVCSGIAGNYFRLLIAFENRPAQEIVRRFRDCSVAASLPVKQPLSRLMGEACPGAETAFSRWVSLPLLADCSEVELQQMQRAIDCVLSA